MRAAASPGLETFMQDFAWYDQQLSRDDYVIGCAAWTLGDWNGANFQAALPALGDYISGEYVIRHYPPRAYLPLIANGLSPIIGDAWPVGYWA